MNSSVIFQSKREIVKFSNQLTKGLSKPVAKFILDMVYGVAKGASPILSDISRSLGEEVPLSATIKRLSRNAASFNDFIKLDQNYLDLVQSQVEDDMLVMVDNSDITKPYGEQFEGLARVYDGSKGGTEKGYLTTNITIASPKTKHPIPIYSHLFSAEETDFVSTNVETYKGLNRVKRLFNNMRYTVVMDRGYDANDIITFLSTEETDFIMRLTDKRWIKSQGKAYKVPELAQRHKGKIAFDSQIKGKNYHLKISHLKVTLPSFPKQSFYMVIVYGYGKKPMKLLTNKTISSKADVLQIVKGYITRWRIEELFRVQKQEYGLEKVRTLTLNSIRLIHRLITYLLGHHAMRIEAAPLLNEIIYQRARCLRENVKFQLYRYIRGLTAILKDDLVGVRHYKHIEHRRNPGQLRLAI